MSDLPNIKDIDLAGFNDADFKVLSTIRGWCYKILPLVYDDSISYYETLAKVTESINDLIKNNNIIPEYMMELILEYINSGTIGTIVQEILATYILNVKYPPDGITPAVGDGSADDHDAIQGCIDYASEHGGGAVYFPTGTYFTTPITLKGDVGLYGFDRYKSKIMLKPSDSNSCLILLKEENNQIANLTLDGNADNQTQKIPTLTTFTGVHNLLLTNLLFNDDYHSIFFSRALEHIQLSDIVFQNYRKHALISEGGSGIQCVNLVFNSGYNADDAINLSSTSDCSIRGLYVDNEKTTNVIDVSYSTNCTVELDTIGNNELSYIDEGGSNNNIRIGLLEKINRDRVNYKANNITKMISGDMTEVTNARTNTYSTLDETVNNNETKTVNGGSHEIYTANKTIDIAGNRIVSVNGDDTFTNNGNTDIHYNKGYHAEFKETPDFHSETDHFIVSSPEREVDVLHLSNDMSNQLHLSNAGTQKYQSDEARYGQGFAQNDSTIMVCVRSADENTADVLFYDRRTGQFIKKSTYTDMGHCNGADYGWGKFWITTWRISGTWNGIAKFDDYGNRVGLVNVTGLKDNDSLVAITIDRVNGLMYGRGRWWDVYELTPDNDTDPQSFTARRIAGKPEVNFDFTAQGMGYYNNMLFYPISEPSGLIITDLKGHTLASYNTYPFAGLFRVKELEEIQIDESTGMAFFFSTFNLPDAAKPTAILQFSKYNLIKPECVDLDGVDIYNDHPTLKVDNSTFNFVRGNKEHPFYDLWEAIFASYALQALGQRGVTIDVTKTNTPYVCGSVRGNAIAILNGNNALVDAFSLRGAAGQFSSLQVQNGITENSFFVIDNFHGTVNSIHAVPTTHTQKILFNCTHSICYLRDISETTFDYNIRAAYSIIGAYDTVGYYLPSSAPVTLINGIDCGAVNCTTTNNKKNTFSGCHLEGNTGWNRFTEYIIGHNSKRYPLSGSGNVTLDDGTIVYLTVASDGLTFRASKAVDVRLYLR